MAIVIGATAIATFGVILTMGQELLPGRIGVASGVALTLPRRSAPARLG